MLDANGQNLCSDFAKKFLREDARAEFFQTRGRDDPEDYFDEEKVKFALCHGTIRPSQNAMRLRFFNQPRFCTVVRTRGIAVDTPFRDDPRCAGAEWRISRSGRAGKQNRPLKG
jgi:hypothetical protein